MVDENNSAPILFEITALWYMPAFTFKVNSWPHGMGNTITDSSFASVGDKLVVTPCLNNGKETSGLLEQVA
jgi:hypothetical protein